MCFGVVADKNGERKPSMKWVPFCLCLFLLGSSHAGCRGVYRTMERPRITIADITLKEIKRFEQVVDSALRRIGSTLDKGHC
jgi:hypothetical protein